MKNLIAFLTILSFVTAIEVYAFGGKPSMKPQLKRDRKDQDKLWRPCQDFEVKNTETRDPVGKLCSRSKGVSKVKDYCSVKDFNFFRDGTFIFIDEDSL